MKPRLRLAIPLGLSALIGWSAGSAVAQSSMSESTTSETSTPPISDRLTTRLQSMQSRLASSTASGAASAQTRDVAAIELLSVGAQQQELARRDRGLNATDQAFIADRLDQLANRYPFLAEAGATELGRGARLPLQAVAPEGLICPGRDRVLLAVGSDRATASVQRSMDVDLTLIAEAVASPYQAGDALSLRVRGPGLDTRVSGAPAGPLLFAGATSSFALKAGRRAAFSAEVTATPGAPHFVRIWAVCRLS